MIYKFFIFKHKERGLNNFHK